MQAGLRSVGAALLLFFWCHARGVRLHEPDGAWRPGVIAGLLFALEFLLLYWGLEYTSAARSVVFLNTSPFFVALGAHWVIATTLARRPALWSPASNRPHSRKHLRQPQAVRSRRVERALRAAGRTGGASLGLAVHLGKRCTGRLP
jgi:hypothetical protein